MNEDGLPAVELRQVLRDKQTVFYTSFICKQVVIVVESYSTEEYCCLVY